MHICTYIYIVYKISANSNQNWIFNEYLNLLKNQTKDPVLYNSVFGQISSKMPRREFSIFITFSDVYTCTCSVESLS